MEVVEDGFGDAGFVAEDVGEGDWRRGVGFLKDVAEVEVLLADREVAVGGVVGDHGVVILWIMGEV